MLSESKLKNKKILVTAGPTPVKIDNVRMITNKFSGKLGIEIAKELYLRGVDVMLFQSYNGIRPPAYLNHILFEDYEEYKKLCLENCNIYEYGIFSAAVADYKPKNVVKGKIPSGGALTNIELIQTEKVINLVKELCPNLKMISFKYEEGKTLDELLNIATKRLKLGHIRVVTNDLTLNGEKQRCFLCGASETGESKVIASAEGKTNIARMIANDLENL
jgi:phosphopantothenoylcysteine decarboxylase/phosphopantothenate--cysteine ligase